MPKLTQAEIKAKADEWAKAIGLVAKAVETKEAFLAPLVEPHDRKIEKLQDQADKIEAEIIAWLDGQPKAIRLEAKKAIAELELFERTTLGPRVIDPEKFIATAKRQNKNPWPCIKVEVGKGEKLLGPKDINSISERSETTTTVRFPSLRLKG
jgi:hypothetical protein